MGGEVLSISCNTFGGELRVAIEEREGSWLHLHVGREGG
jgi:hypothetical protein